MNVFIFHGTMGSPKGNWFPWLERELKGLGIEVFVPKFPTPEGQSLDNWLKTFEPYQKYVNKESVFVGHSMGPGFIFRLLERRKSPIKAAILAAPFYKQVGEEPFISLNKSFVDNDFDWEKIRINCGKFIVFYGDDDPYIPIEQPKFIAATLKAELNIIKGGKHLNKDTADMVQFPEVLAAISRFGAVPLK